MADQLHTAITGSSSPYEEKACYGAEKDQPAFTPDYGDTKNNWYNSPNGGWNKFTITSDNPVTSSIVKVDEGKDRLRIIAFGAERGVYPKISWLESIEFKYAVNSTASHAVFLKNFGVGFFNSGLNYKKWAGPVRSKVDSFNLQTITIKPSQHGALWDAAGNDGYFFRLLLWLSTEGGAVRRESEIKFQDFRFRYKQGNHYNDRIVLPPVRIANNSALTTKLVY